MALKHHRKKIGEKPQTPKTSKSKNLDEWVLTDEYAEGMSFFNDHVSVSKDQLINLYGEPIDAEYTYLYTFKNKEGKLVTLYDYCGVEGCIGAESELLSKQFKKWFDKKVLKK